MHFVSYLDHLLLNDQSYWPRFSEQCRLHCSKVNCAWSSQAEWYIPASSTIHILGKENWQADFLFRKDLRGYSPSECILNTVRLRTFRCGVGEKKLTGFQGPSGLPRNFSSNPMGSVLPVVRFSTFQILPRLLRRWRETQWFSSRWTGPGGCCFWTYLDSWQTLCSSLDHPCLLAQDPNHHPAAQSLTLPAWLLRHRL